jgi:Spo0E like sporulation regulatory protein.
MTTLETTELITRLQQLQSRLCEMADDLGNLTDPEIVAVSEEADRLIVQLQRLRKEESQLRKLNSVCPVSVLSASQSAEEVGKQSRTFSLKHS